MTVAARLLIDGKYRHKEPGIADAQAVRTAHCDNFGIDGARAWVDRANGDACWPTAPIGATDPDER